MSAFTITAEDTFTVNGIVLSNFADGSVINLTHNNNLMSMVTGKNGSSVYAKNEQGVNASVELRVQRGSYEDRLLHELMSQQEADAVSFKLIQSVFTKHLGDGQGNVLSDTYTLTGGFFVQRPDVFYSTTGDAESGIITYSLQYAKSERTIG